MQSLNDLLCTGSGFQPEKSGSDEIMTSYEPKHGVYCTYMREELYKDCHTRTGRSRTQGLDTHLTKAMILGGLLSLVWKNRLLLIKCGETKAANVYKNNRSMASR